MITSIDGYLETLKKALIGCDIATIQDALSDAEEHLRTAIEIGLENSDKVIESELLENIIEKYGTPEETANAYRDMESRLNPTFARDSKTKKKSLIGRFFGIFADAGAWSSLIYMLLALITGTIYFSWVTTGISTGLSTLILIIGIPIIILFLYSIRGLAFIEGRLVEALLGERMPRRSKYRNKNVKLIDKIKDLFTDRSTWSGILYFILQLPLGIIYFTLIVTLLSVSIAIMAAPIIELLTDLHLVNIGATHYAIPTIYFPLLIIAGFLLLTITMHIAKFIGKYHGKYAKALLIKE